MTFFEHSPLSVMMNKIYFESKMNQFNNIAPRTREERVGSIFPDAYVFVFRPLRKIER